MPPAPPPLPRIELLWPGKHEAPPGPPPALIEVERRGSADRAALWTGTDTPADHAGGGPAGGARAAGGLLVHGDCLGVARALGDELGGKVDLIYIDPPYATGQPFSFTGRVGGAAVELEAYDDRWGGGKAGFLSMIWPRLRAARDLLSEEGLLFVHLDHNAVHEVKVLLDELMGPRSFRAELIWELGTGAKGRKFFSVQHQTLLAYSRGARWFFDPETPLAREPFADLSLATHFREVDAEGRRIRRRVVNGKEYVYRADHGRMIGSVWGDVPAMRAGSPLFAESTGYPTQKPERLIERILRTCAPPGGLVADLFCGSGTTLAVAQRLGLRWLGADVGPLAIQTSHKRLVAGLGGEAATHYSLLRASDQPALPALIGATAAIDPHPEGGQRVTLGVTLATPPASVPEALRSAAPEDLVDSWSLDPSASGPFCPRWSWHRTRSAPGLALSSPPVAVGPGARLRLVDARGGEAWSVLGEGEPAK
jgi:hypothetical protein